MGAIAYLPGFQQQRHFLVPAINLDLDPGLEINLGFGFGMTRASNGVFIKSIFGWTFLCVSIHRGSKAYDYKGMIAGFIYKQLIRQIRGP